ncbi:Sodium/potassium/calcium exchanger 6, mitochondrial [Cyberlindnera fabianii]|uniref:Sodium/potassium/calcium exchanger 6, mitochondrial n=1 Tax=Cyberlindnera fabianii TaxID=36022 RepID=A0A1V2L3R4_CYBFA|nr:Sodium/potassium/calcium exchanger 6, mitochondrial [Cyberlindnera fabianii]
MRLTRLGTLTAGVVLVVGENLSLQQRQNDTNYIFPTVQADVQSPSSPLNSNITGECHDISDIPGDQQCQFALDHCGDYKIGFVNYVSFYYCRSGRVLTLFMYAVELICLFTTLGITASEFLCPNLDTISKFFKMSENLAGVTLLALGNGSPDVFSTLEALKIGSSDLALGELMGAALFITAVVVGSMAIVKPFKVVTRPFVRDVLFLLISLVITAVFLSDGELSLFEALAMILIYVLYVVFVVSWDWAVTKKRKVQLLDQKVRNRFFDDASRYSLQEFQIEENLETNDEDILNDLAGPVSGGVDVLDTEFDSESQQHFDEWTRRSSIQKFRPSILGALDMNHRLTDLEEEENLTGNISLDTIAKPKAFYPSKTPLRSPSPIRMTAAPAFADANDDEQLAMDANEYEARTMSSREDFDMYHDDAGIALMTGHLPDFVDAHDSLKAFLSNGPFAKRRGLLNTFFPTLKGFKTKSLSDKIISIICLPTVTLLRITIPVVLTDEKEIDNETALAKEFVLLLIQCIVSPLIATMLIFEIHLIHIIIALVISCILVTLAFRFRNHHKNGNESLSSIFTCCLSCFGFFISINWISTIATELISIIKFFAVYFDISDAILGVTVFAIGNSLGDFISNFTIAKMGFPIMALSACFGGPLLNILLGIGGSALYVIPTSGENIKLHISWTLIISAVTLLINLVFLLLAVPANGWYMDKTIGVTMIGLWSCATLVCVVLEWLNS